MAIALRTLRRGAGPAEANDPIKNAHLNKYINFHKELIKTSEVFRAGIRPQIPATK